MNLTIEEIKAAFNKTIKEIEKLGKKRMNPDIYYEKVKTILLNNIPFANKRLICFFNTYAMEQIKLRSMRNSMFDDVLQIYYSKTVYN